MAQFGHHAGFAGDPDEGVAVCGGAQAAEAFDQRRGLFHAAEKGVQAHGFGQRQRGQVGLFGQPQQHVAGGSCGHVFNHRADGGQRRQIAGKQVAGGGFEHRRGASGGGNAEGLAGGGVAGEIGGGAGVAVQDEINADGAGVAVVAAQGVGAADGAGGFVCPFGPLRRGFGQHRHFLAGQRQQQFDVGAVADKGVVGQIGAVKNDAPQVGAQILVAEHADVAGAFGIGGGHGRNRDGVVVRMRRGSLKRQNAAAKSFQAACNPRCLARATGSLKGASGFISRSGRRP